MYLASRGGCEVAFPCTGPAAGAPADKMLDPSWHGARGLASAWSRSRAAGRVALQARSKQSGPFLSMYLCQSSMLHCALSLSFSLVCSVSLITEGPVIRRPQPPLLYLAWPLLEVHPPLLPPFLSFLLQLSVLQLFAAVELTNPISIPLPSSVVAIPSFATLLLDL